MAMLLLREQMAPWCQAKKKAAVLSRSSFGASADRQRDRATQTELPGCPTEGFPEVLCSHMQFAEAAAGWVGGGRERGHTQLTAMQQGSMPAASARDGTGREDTSVFGQSLAWGKRAEHLLFPG